MELYSAPPSYYSMIARLALNESNIEFNTHYMDIHIAKEQLAPWYIALNRHMTVPTLTDAQTKWTDSRDILNYAAKHAGNAWYDSEPQFSPDIQKIVAAHYQIPIEKLTFGKVMVKHSLLHKLFPSMLKRIIKQLEKESQTDPEAVQKKIAVDEERLAYFSQGDQLKKLNDRREEVREFIRQLPEPQSLLFGEKPSSADIVTSILFARLKMIDEDELIKVSPSLADWFNRMEQRPAFAKSDIWLRFKPWRILLKY
ncbi:MAG: glutathione S-transferase family protein [Candidatus Berkiella sp.]